MSRVTIYGCENSAFWALDTPAFRQAHPDWSVEQLRCGGRVPWLPVTEAWSEGDLVKAFFLCPSGNCRYLHGGDRAADELERLAENWASVGVTGRSLLVYRLGSCLLSEIARAVEEIKNMEASLVRPS